MTVAPEGAFRSLSYLVPFGAVTATIAAGFFWIAFLWLVPPNPTEPANLDASAQALEIKEAQPPASNDTAPGSMSSATLADDGVGSTMPVAPSAVEKARAKSTCAIR
jgi:hypothetical protein